MFKTCSVDSDVKQDRRNTKRRERSTRTSPKGEIFGHNNLFLSGCVKVSRLITVLLFTINPASDLHVGVFVSFPCNSRETEVDLKKKKFHESTLISV